MPWRDVEPCQPPQPEESCNAATNYLAGFFEPPAPLYEAANEARLIWPLRAAARTDPTTMLALSAATYVLASVPAASLPGPAPAEPPFPPTATPPEILRGGALLVAGNGAQIAQAFADLAVSGRAAHAAFRASPPEAATIAAMARTLLAGVAGVTDDRTAAAAQQAMARATEVAECLDAVVPSATARQPLGWVAVSAEDDPPRRPVNISSLAYPQYDVTVPVQAPSGQTVQIETRYAIISRSAAASLQPHIPPDDVVLLFLHGDGSRLEEVSPLIEPLLSVGAPHGRSYTILAMDLPSHGCSTMVDPLGPAFAGTPPWDNHAPTPPDRPPSYPVLELLEQFVVSFVSTLDAQLHFTDRLVGPMGGSLGGNLCLRLSRRSEPWLRQSVAWSPASIWGSLAADAVKQAGPNHCSTLGHAPEDAGARAAFMDDVFDASTSVGPVQLVAPQGDYWYRDDWQPCKTNLLDAARHERRELYNRIYRQWHYRMDWEQLIYSYNDADPGSSEPRYASFRSRLLLGAGAEDDNSPATQIYSSARTLSSRLVSTAARGRSFFVEHTGHSIHDERPALLAAQIDAFTTETLGGGREWLHVTGNPIVRFTGDVHDWSHPLALAPADADDLVLQLLLTVQTGGDDLRGGSTCDVVVAPMAPFANVNGGAHWNNGETHTVQLVATAATFRVSQLAALALETHFGGGISGDNWNVNGIVLEAVVDRAAGGAAPAPVLVDTPPGPLVASESSR